MFLWRFEMRTTGSVAVMHLLLQVGAAWGGLWGSTLRSWIPQWNIQPGLYGVMAGASVLAGVFR